MRAPASNFRSLALLRAGLVAPRSAPSATPPASRWLSPRILTYLVPLMLLGMLAACDGPGLTGPESSATDVPESRGREVGRVGVR